MITRVAVKNYQSFEETDVELGTLTVIVGPNDLGKSAFFRAVRSAVEASSGKDFIKQGHTQTKVTLYVDGRELIWEKGANVNRYILDGELYDKVGRETPSDVSSLLSMGPVQFDKDLSLSLNFADQDDPPFLIPFPGGVTTSKVAKVLGDLTNLNVLFRALGESDTRRKRSESEATIRKSDIASIEGQLAAYEGIDEDVKRSEQLSDQLRLVQTTRKRLETLVQVKSVLGDLRSEHTKLLSTRKQLKPDITEPVDALKSNIERLQQLRTYKRESVILSAEGNDLQDQAQAVFTDLSEAEQTLESFMKEIKVCPMCGQKIDAARPVHSHA